MNYRVVMADEAFVRLEEQARYIAVDEAAPLEADRWLIRVLDAAESLGVLPRRCPRAFQADELTYEVRVLNIDGFLLFFSVNDESRTVNVLYARHGRQQPRPGEPA